MIDLVESCHLEKSGMPTKFALRIFPLGSYNILICMDWLENHRTKVDCYGKSLECISEEGEEKVLQEIKQCKL